MNKEILMKGCKSATAMPFQTEGCTGYRRKLTISEARRLYEINGTNTVYR